MDSEKKVKPKRKNREFRFRKVKRAEVELVVERYLEESNIQNTKELTQIIQRKTAHEILARLSNRKELFKHGRIVFGNNIAFLDYLFDAPLALGGKMPIEFCVDDTGAQAIIDELVRIEYGILC